MWHACKPSGRGAWRPARSLEISHDVGHMVPGTTRRETRDARGARKMHRPRSHASQLAMSTAGCGAQARGLADDMCAVESARLTARAPGAGPGPFLPGLSRAVCASPSSTVRVVSAGARVHRGGPGRGRGVAWMVAGMVVVRICINDHLTEYRYEGRFKVTTPQIRAQIAQREHDVASTADGAVSRTGYRRGRTGLRRSAT